MARRTYRLAAFDRKWLGEAPGIMGIDEVGRGAYAGPVVACAVWLAAGLYRDQRFLRDSCDVDDSKRLTEAAREAIYKRATVWKTAGRVAFAVGMATPREVEELNIVGATRQAMCRAIETLCAERPDICLAESDTLPLLHNGRADTPLSRLLLDGKPLSKFPWAHDAVVGGDAQSLAIALASVVAKVTRDRMMIDLEGQYPQYGFARHKGYGVPAHLQSILANGPCVEHRRTFLQRLRRPDGGQHNEDWWESQGV